MSYSHLFRSDHHSMRGIQHPGKNDVLFGRGGAINSHIGNIMFRKIVDEQRPFYFAASKADKPLVALKVVQIIRRLDPPGRFLAPMKDSERNLVKGEGVLWYDVGNKKARAKASQCLRERKMCDAYTDNEMINDDEYEMKEQIPFNVSSYQDKDSPNKLCIYTAGLVPESPLSTGHGLLRNHLHDDGPIMFEYSPISTAYLKQNFMHPYESSTPALMTYQDLILPTVSRSDETGLIGNDDSMLDPLHFFELNCRASNLTMSNKLLHREEQYPHTTSIQDESNLDPLLLMLPSNAGAMKGNFSWTPSFHSNNSTSYDLDVSNNTFTVTVEPRCKENDTKTFLRPTLVQSLSVLNDGTESMSDLTDSSATSELF